VCALEGARRCAGERGSQDRSARNHRTQTTQLRDFAGCEDVNTAGLLKEGCTMSHDSRACRGRQTDVPRKRLDITAELKHGGNNVRDGNGHRLSAGSGRWAILRLAKIAGRCSGTRRRLGVGNRGDARASDAGARLHSQGVATGARCRGD
jgi:hypothetical protein